MVDDPSARYPVTMTPATRQRFLDRLRKEEVTTTVTGTWPQLFLGKLVSAGVVTLGVDPASKGSKFLKEGANRSEATDQNLDALLAAAEGAFKEPVAPWFQDHQEVLEGMGLSYEAGDVAHLDLVQEKLIHPWADWHGLNASGANELLRRDISFLNWQLESFPMQTVVCTNRMVLDNMLPKVGGRVVEQGSIDKLRWMIAVGTAAGRTIALVGWNVNLSKMETWTRRHRNALGKRLKDALNEARETQFS